MSRYLLIDIGAGTMDVLLFNDTSHLHYKAVVKSPARLLSEKIIKIPGDILVTGCEMGGSPVSSVLKERATHHRVYMTEGAAATINHQTEKVEKWGIKVLDSDDIPALKAKYKLSEVHLADLNLDRIKKIVEGFGEPFEFDAVGICAQDHGIPPSGVSHIDFRNRMFQSMLEKDASVHRLLFQKEEIPTPFNRLTCIARSAKAIPTKETYVMDSGMAAMLGASKDRLVTEKKCFLVLDIATSHTVAAVWNRQTLAGFVEYHTKDVTSQRIDGLLRDLANGQLSHDSIVAQGGHGACVMETVGFKNIEVILATGPKRFMVSDSFLDIKLGAPWGDNMMTGTVGLLAAILARKGRHFKDLKTNI